MLKLNRLDGIIISNLIKMKCIIFFLKFSYIVYDFYVLFGNVLMGFVCFYDFMFYNRLFFCLDN